jgi:hypothetical protein
MAGAMLGDRLRLVEGSQAPPDERGSQAERHLLREMNGQQINICL